MNIALDLFQKGNFGEAVNHCDKLIIQKPERKGAYLLKAQIFIKQEKFIDAEKVLKEGFDTTGELTFQANLGIILSKNGEHEKALESFGLAQSIKIKDEIFYFHLGKSFGAVGRFRKAIEAYKNCLNIKPHYSPALNNLANLYQKLGETKKAIVAYQKLVELHPNDALVYNNLGSLYEKTNKISDAKYCYKKSLELDSTLSVTYFNLAQLMGGQYSDYSSALGLLDKGLAVGDESYWKGLRYYQILYRQHIADWSEYEKDVDDLNLILEQHLSGDSSLPFDVVPYTLSYSKISNHLYRRIAESYAKTIEKRVKIKYPNVKYDHSLSSGKIKIGYYSPNMRLHPGGLLVRKLFDYHDSKKFEIHAFSLVESNDFVSQEIKDSVDYFHDISMLDTLGIANLINRTGIDILVSLAFYNTSMNVEVLALRPAPIQMILLGSHETSGASFIDYTFSDKFMMDKEIRKNFTESIITLPCCLILNCELPIDTSIKTTRSDHDLPEKAFVYASFNHPRKLDPETFDAWVEILLNVPESVLWLYDGGSKEVRSSLRGHATKKGLEANRIIFANQVKLKEHWERIQHADLILDCFVYNAHVTGIEALRLGVPMISLKGTNHNSRIGSSLLYYSGLKNCAIFNKNDYIHGSISIGTHKMKILAMHEALVSNVENLLFDTEIQVRYLEMAYRKALVRYRKGMAPKDFSVSSALEFDSFNMDI